MDLNNIYPIAIKYMNVNVKFAGALKKEKKFIDHVFHLLAYFYLNREKKCFNVTCINHSE